MEKEQCLGRIFDGADFGIKVVEIVYGFEGYVKFRRFCGSKEGKLCTAKIHYPADGMSSAYFISNRQKYFFDNCLREDFI